LPAVGLTVPMTDIARDVRVATPAQSAKTYDVEGEILPLQFLRFDLSLIVVLFGRCTTENRWSS
jgi:hypothetical protein